MLQDGVLAKCLRTFERSAADDDPDCRSLPLQPCGEGPDTFQLLADPIGIHLKHGTLDCPTHQTEGISDEPHFVGILREFAIYTI